MENRRPNFNFLLALLATAAPANCTVATPKLKLTRQVRQLVMQSQVKAEECNALYNLTGAINTRLAQADSDLARVQATGATDELLQNAQASRDQIQKELDNVMAKVVALNDTQYDILKQQVVMIANIPNDANGQPQDESVIDWDNCDQEELKGAVDFFLNGPKK